MNGAAGADVTRKIPSRRTREWGVSAAIYTTAGVAAAITTLEVFNIAQQAADNTWACKLYCFAIRSRGALSLRPSASLARRKVAPTSVDEMPPSSSPFDTYVQQDACTEFGHTTQPNNSCCVSGCTRVLLQLTWRQLEQSEQR